MILSITSSNRKKLEDKDSKTNITSNSISREILSLIEFSSQVNSECSSYKKLQEDLIVYFSKLLERRNSLDLLKSYFNEDKLKDYKVISKLEKNIMIYLPILIEYVYQQKEGKSEVELQNIIKESFKKILILLFIYWDKTSLSLFSRLIKLDLDELKIREKDFINHQIILQDTEKNISSSFIDLPEEYVNKKFLKEDIYARTYRIIIEKTDEKFNLNWNKDRIELLKETAAKEIDITLSWLYTLFLKTIELKTNLDIRLKNLWNSFIKILWLINKLKELNVLDNSYNILNNKKYNSIFFHDFIDLIQDKNNHFDDFIAKIMSNSWTDKNKLRYNFTELDKDEFENIKIQWLNKELWNSFSTDQKYIFFLKKVLWLNSWIIKVSSNFKFTHLSVKSLASKFWELYWYDKNTILNQIEFFKSKKIINLIDFIKTDLDNLIFLYEWWEFLINWWDIAQKPDFLNDTISWLINEWIISNNIEIKTEWEFYNLSAVNIWLQINFLFNDLSRWNIELNKFKIWKFLFKDVTKFYCNSEKDTLEESILYLNNAIDACINVLNWKAPNHLQWNYIVFLQDLDLLPLDLSKIKIVDKDRIIKLIPWLKLVKLKIEILKKMQEVSKQDMENVGDIFSNIWLDTNIYDKRTWNSIWPNKDFWRIVVKLIKSYSWDFHKIWDLNRFRLVWKLNSWDTKTIKSIISDVIWLKNNPEVLDIWFENSAGHLLSNPIKSSWYRDIKANVLLKSWNIVEIQIHFDEMISAKSWDIPLNSNIKQILEKNNSLLKSDEVDNLIELYYDSFWKYPSKNFILNISTLNEAQLIKLNLWEWKINCDMLYKLSRTLDSWSHIKNKLIMIERILFNSQWSEVSIKYFENIWLKLKETKSDIKN